MDIVFFSGGGGSVTNGIRSTPELDVLALFVFEECGHSSDFVLASTCSPRLPVFLGFPYIS